jgi:signal peptidase II
MTRPTAALLALAVLIADQATKWLVTTQALAAAPASFSAWFAAPPAAVEGTNLPLLPFLDLTLVLNRGVSFGLLSGAHGIFTPLLLSVVTLAVTAALAVWLARSAPGLQRLALALIIGGAAGNLVDRLRLGVVVDFVDFHAWGWHWPAFNLADAAIVAGVGLIVLTTLLREGET